MVTVVIIIVVSIVSISDLLLQGTVSNAGLSLQQLLVFVLVSEYIHQVKEVLKTTRFKITSVDVVLGIGKLTK